MAMVLENGCTRVLFFINLPMHIYLKVTARKNLRKKLWFPTFSINNDGVFDILSIHEVYFRCIWTIKVNWKKKTSAKTFGRLSPPTTSTINNHGAFKHLSNSDLFFRCIWTIKAHRKEKTSVKPSVTHIC